MKLMFGVSLSTVLRVLALTALVGATGCSSTTVENEGGMPVATPTVDYIEGLDVYSAPHKDSFLNQLAMNYRSYAIYNTRASGYPEIGELFANKAVAAFSGELPFPETVDNWGIKDEKMSYELSLAYNEMIEQLQNDAGQTHPELAAEMQAKYDCWVSAVASNQAQTARECKVRFQKALKALRECTDARITPNVISGGTVTTTEMIDTSITKTTVADDVAAVPTVDRYYPETSRLAAMRGVNRTREGVVIVNNVTIPEHLIKPEPVQPLVFNQNIYGGDKTINDNSGSNSNNVTNSGNTTTMVKSDCPCANRPVPEMPQMQSVTLNMPFVERDIPGADDVRAQYGPEAPQEYVSESMTAGEPMTEPCECANDDEPEEITIVADELVSRREFIDMMMAMRAELAAINARLDNLQVSGGEKASADCEEETTIIKVQQIPVEPKQHIMEEVFEIRFDFNKAAIKPEYEDIIRKLVDVTQANRNVKISVVGHTDTAGNKNYNYALGGRRAEAVQKMLIEYGIPSSQIVAVSAGEEDLKVPTPDGVPNAENRRVRVVKEVSYMEPGETKMVPVADVTVADFVEETDDFGNEE